MCYIPKVDDNEMICGMGGWDDIRLCFNNIQSSIITLHYIFNKIQAWEDGKIYEALFPVEQVRKSLRIGSQNFFPLTCHLMSCSCQLKIRPKSFASQLIQNIENSIVVTNIVIFCHRVCSLTFITWGSSSQSIWPRYSRKRRIDAKLIRAPHQFSLLVKTTFVFLYICEPY